LEKAAHAKDYEYINANNARFTAIVQLLISDIETMLNEFDEIIERLS